MEICLALGGGGIKGIAHIGVLESLEQAGFQIRAIAGTSVGALVGSIYAGGYSPREILEILESLSPNRMYTRQPKDGPSLLGYTGLADALTAMLTENTFADLKIPFACTAVDIRTAQEVYINDGRVIDAVLASIAIPGIFPPKIRGEAELVDGGVLDPVPVNLARLLAPRLPVVSVVLNPKREDWALVPQFNFTPPGSIPIPVPLVEGFSRLRVGQALRIFLQSMDITARMLTELRLQIDRPEVIIRPDVYEYGILDQVPPMDLFQRGLQAGKSAVPSIHKALSWTRRIARLVTQTWIVSGQQREETEVGNDVRSPSQPGDNQDHA